MGRRGKGKRRGRKGKGIEEGKEGALWQIKIYDYRSACNPC